MSAGTTVIDAYALLWFLEGDERLSIEARRRMSDPTSRLVVPSIALAEACWAIHKGTSRLTIDDLSRVIRLDERFVVAAIDGDIVFAASALAASLEMHDRLIAATAAREMALDASTVLLTCDGPLTASGVVRTVW